MAVNKSKIRRELVSRTARVWSRLNKKLNKDLNEIAQAWLKKLIVEAENEIASGNISNIPDFPEEFTKILQQTLREALAYGYWLQQLYLYERRGKKYKGKITLSEGDEVKELLESFIVNGEWNDVIPEDAINWIKNYVPKLAGIFKEDVLEKTRDVMLVSLFEGSTLKERVKALRKAAPELSAMTQHRLEAIARTEITRADTLGRLTSMKANDDVIGVEFSAIMDDRTTDICASRHGLVMRLDDPRLPENTPPLHVNCRSMLISLTVYDYPDGLLTSHEFEEIPRAIQRPEDIEEVRKILEGKIDVKPKIEEKVKNNEEASLIAKIQELQDKKAGYLQEIDSLLFQIFKATDDETYNLLESRQQNLEKIVRDIEKTLKELKIQAADKGVILASGIAETLDKADVDNVIKLLKNASPDVRKVWNLHEDIMKIADTDYEGTSHYSPTDKSIYIQLWRDKLPYKTNRYQTMFHELGHLIDNADEEYYSKDCKFNLYDTLTSEVNSYIDTVLKRLKAQAASEGKDSESISIKDVHTAIQKELDKFSYDACRGLSDVFSGVTLNKVVFDAWHPTSYWERDRKKVCLEFFAETYSSSIVNPEAIEVLKKYIPKSYDIFTEILKDIIKRSV